MLETQEDRRAAWAEIREFLVRAGALAALGKLYLEAGCVETADQHVPEYLRLSQAERELMERQKREKQS